jgi:hypothetical protein
MLKQIKKAIQNLIKRDHLNAFGIPEETSTEVFILL